MLRPSPTLQKSPFLPYFIEQNRVQLLGCMCPSSDGCNVTLRSLHHSPISLGHSWTSWIPCTAISIVADEQFSRLIITLCPPLGSLTFDAFTGRLHTRS